MPNLKPSRSDASDQDEISSRDALYCLHGNGSVERGKSAVISNGQTKQVRIRDFLVPADHQWPKQRLIDERHRVLPEVMVRRGAKTSQAAGHFCGSRLHGGICRITQDADKAIYRYRACRPSVLSIPAEPTVRVFVIVVRRIEESHQDIHV